MTTKRIVKILAAISFFIGLVFIFFEWRIGATLLILWFFLNGSVSVWLTKDDVPSGTSKEVHNAVKRSVKNAKNGGVVLAIIEVIALYFIW